MAMACTVCSAQTTVSSLKYWLDSDFSGAKTVNLTEGSTSTQFDVDIASQGKGVHFFYVMPKGSDDKWGKLHRYMYLIPDTDTDTEGTTIKGIEYWMDGDLANRKTESTTNTTIPLSIDIGAYAHGVHTLSYRVINDKGQYSPIKIFAFFVNPAESSATSVTSVEYWIDGNYATRTTAQASGNEVLMENLDISSLSTGVHFLYVQPKDDLGHLGKLHRYMFLKPFTEVEQDGTAISRVEYWIDDNFSSMVTKQTSETVIPIEADLSSLGYGSHFLTYRVVNNLGQYGEIKRLMFYFLQGEESATLKGYEYWIDDDYAGRKSGSALGENDNVEINDIDISSLSEGVHFFYVRTLDANDKYGKLHRNMFYIPKAADDSRTATMGGMEYWIDGDIENKTVVNSDATTTPLSIDISQLKYGMHTFSYRAFNSLGEMSTLVNKLFYINDKDYSTQQPLTGYRYFFNDRKGESAITGNVTQFDSPIDLSIPNTKLVPINLDSCKFVFDSPAAGKATMNRNVQYDFTIQFKNKAGEWNAPVAHIFAVPEVVEADITEVALEGSETFTKVEGGNIKVLKFVVTKEDTYYFSSPQNGYMGLYNADGSIRGSLSPSEMISGYSDYLEPGTYYGVVHNTIKDGDNIEDDYTVRFNTSSIKIGKLITNVKDNVLYLLCATEGVKIYYTTDGSTPTAESTLYTADGIKLTENIRIQAIAVKEGMLNSDYLTYDVDQFRVADPEIKIENLKFVVTTATEGATIYYTLDGTSPLISGIKYTGPISLISDVTIIAAAKKDNYNTSDEVSKTFALSEWTCKEPLFTREENLLKITSETDGAVIYYTLDGNDPSIKSTKYPEGGITLTQNCTVKAIATLQGTMYPSEIKSFTASDFKVATPTIKVENTKIVIECATEGASIYYRLESGTPTLDNSIKYTGPIEWSEDTYVRAFAMKDNYVTSSATSSIRLSVSDYQCKKPVISVKDNVVTMTTTTEGGTIYYTLDGSTPTSESTAYTAPFTLTDNRTVKAITAIPGKLFNSEVSTYEGKGFAVAEPTMKVDNLKVVLECATEGAKIYYTTNTEVDVTTAGTLYTSPIPFTADMIISFYAKKDNLDNSSVQTTYLYASEYTCKKPTFQVQRASAANGYKDKVTITSADGGTIYYTLDGNDPSYDSPSRQTGSEFELTKNCKILAVAAKSGMFQSDTVAYNIDFIKAKTPVMAFDETKKQLTITCATTDAKIFYTIGGTTPSATSIEYTGALTLADNREIKAIAISSDCLNSSVASYKPTYFSCAPVTVEYDGRSVKFACTTEGAAIYYTTNGYTPSDDSNKYDGNAVILDGISTVKAVAIKSNLNNATVTFEPTAYYNGGKTYVTKAGDLEKAYKWCGKEKVIDVSIEGSLNAADITTIKGMKAAKYLDLSDVTIAEKTLPEKAFEGLDLISFSSPADITEAGDSLLKDAKSIGAVVWNADIAVPENIMGDITPVNALLYVQNDDHKNSKFRNVVVNGVASEITLSDAEAMSNFYCPVEFTADKISYRHTYTLPTEKNVLTGWEALSLPFTPTSISHSKNGECVPFEAYKKNPESGKPFWLCELTSTGFAKAEQIVANKGYIVCMPNNEDYGDEYILGGNGDITYMAEGATIPVTATAFDDPAMMNDYIFRPNYAHLAQSDTVMVINKTDYGTNRPGSVFVPNLRPAYPFEAYVTKSPTSSSKAAPLRVDGGEVGIMETLYGFGDINQTVYSEDGALYIFSKTAGKVKIYKSTGILYKTVDVRSGWTRVDDLAKDVYVVKGRKVIVR